MMEEESKKFVKDFSDFVNSWMGMNETQVADYFVKEHRFLQSLMLKIIFAILRKCAEQYKKGEYVGQCEYEYRCANNMVEHMYDNK